GSHEEKSLGYSCRCSFRATLSLEYFLAGEKAGEDQGRRRLSIGHANVLVARQGRKFLRKKRSQIRKDQYSGQFPCDSKGGGGRSADYSAGRRSVNPGQLLRRGYGYHRDHRAEVPLLDFCQAGFRADGGLEGQGVRHHSLRDVVRSCRQVCVAGAWHRSGKRY